MFRNKGNPSLIENGVELKTERGKSGNDMSSENTLEREEKRMLWYENMLRMCGYLYELNIMIVHKLVGVRNFSHILALFSKRVYVMLLIERE